MLTTPSAKVTALSALGPLGGLRSSLEPLIVPIRSKLHWTFSSSANNAALLTSLRKSCFSATRYTNLGHGTDSQATLSQSSSNQWQSPRPTAWQKSQHIWASGCVLKSEQLWRLPEQSNLDLELCAVSGGLGPHSPRLASRASRCALRNRS